MKNKILIYGVSLLAVVACRTSHNIANVQTQKNLAITSSIVEDGTSAALIAPYKKMMDSQMNSKISHTIAELNKQGENSNLGNLLADYTFEGANSWAKKNQLPEIDAAVINIGGIRSIIGKGDILLRHVYEVMPFENELVIVKINGKDLNSLFNYYLETKKNNPISHLKIETLQGKISTALINGKPVDASKTYYIATSDYLALGGDNMKFFGIGQIISTGIKLRDLYIEKFKQNPEVIAPNDVRLRFDK